MDYPIDELQGRIETLESKINLLLKAKESYPSDRVTPAMAAKIIHMTRNHFYQIAKQELSHFKIGGRFYYSRKELEAWVESKKVKPGAEKTNGIVDHRISRLRKKRTA